MPFCRFLLFLLSNWQVDASLDGASPHSPSSSGKSQSTGMLHLVQPENQGRTIARGTHASLTMNTMKLELLENLGLWIMLTLGASVTSTVANQMSAITGIGGLVDSVYYTQRLMALMFVPKTSILVSKDVTIQL